MKSRRRGLSLIEALLAAACGLALLACALPAIAQARSTARSSESLSNLMTLGLGHAIYAMDWDGRQPTYVVDDLASYGDSLWQAFTVYTNEQGGYGDPENFHPPITPGWGLHDDEVILFAYLCGGNMANASLTIPINFHDPISYFGSFRLPNTRQFRQYLSNRFYDPVFYAPTDPVVYPIVADFFDEPWEYVYSEPLPGFGDAPMWSSYITSPAAMLHPDVMRHPDAGGWQHPWLLDHAMESPSLFAATYGNLKTLMLEHHWLQDAPPDPCNPVFAPGTYGGCEPYYFNHAIASAPATLFYDLSTDFLPNTEVRAADQLLIERTGHGLWSRDTPYGSNGYFNQAGYDDTDLSHHILTTDGILGRDRIEH